jgi:hypothetical protein
VRQRPLPWLTCRGRACGACSHTRGGTAGLRLVCAPQLNAVRNAHSDSVPFGKGTPRGEADEEHAGARPHVASRRDRCVP